MKSFKIFFTIFLLIYSVLIFGQEKPRISFEELMISAEKDFQQVLDVRKLTETYDLPHTIYLPEGIFIEAKGIENNQVVYTIVNDLLHPFNNGEIAFWEEIYARFDLTKARIHWSNKPTQNPKLGYNFIEQENMAISFVMGPESTNDAVMSFNYNDGSLINATYIPGGNPNLSTPIEALLTPSATILVSDQLTDNIVEFDTLGTFVRVLFGGNPAILDNCRGITLRPGMNTVLATPSSGTNQDAIAEFDLTTGNYLGNFIAPNATQLNGPWDIIFRTLDCLVSGESSDNIVRYDLSGNYIGNFVASINFPEQINTTLSSNIIAANFSAPTGLYIYDSLGNQLNFFSAVTALRGCIQLGNGNYMVTNSSGVFVLDQNTGAVIAIPIAGVGARSLREYELSSTPATFQLSVNVTNGWNMVSIPGLHPVDQNVSTWWPGLTGTVWGFNGVQYVGKTIATPGEGYWMKHVGAIVYNYPAIQIVAHTPLNALSGWNMIGGYENSVATIGLVTSPPNQITGTIWGFNGVQYVAANTIVPGYSYWVKLLPGCPCTITIPEALSKGTEAVEYFSEGWMPKAEWGRIILTDAAGLSYTLYAVKGDSPNGGASVDLDQYELPPMPPAGMFDIRFSSGRIAEDINSAMQTIEMNGVTYPLTVRVEGMDIRLQDVTGKQINLNLKSGEDIVISDATIQKLMVSGELIPDKYALEQNYPNPFNPITTIKFSIPEATDVTLTIYNVLGEKVAELVNTALTAGKYSYQWNAQNVATGMYIYELRTDKFVSVKKMMLMK